MTPSLRPHQRKSLRTVGEYGTDRLVVVLKGDRSPLQLLSGSACLGSRPGCGEVTPRWPYLCLFGSEIIEVGRACPVRLIGVM